MDELRPLSETRTKGRPHQMTESTQSGSWRICQSHWDRLRKDLDDQNLLLANVEALGLLYPKVQGRNPEMGTVCPICFNDNPLAYESLIARVKEMTA